MNRRKFLRQSSALGVAGLAGCIADAADDTDDTQTPDGTSTPDDPTTPADGTPEPDRDVTVTDASVERTQTSCNSGADPTAVVSVDEEAGVVTFWGQVSPGTPCYDVSLERAEYDADADRLSVVVETEREDGPCVDCVGLVEFEGRVAFEGGVPGGVAIGHGDTLLTGSGDESPPKPAGTELVAGSFSVVGVDSGAPEGTADVEFDEDEGTVTVTGTITGSDGCATAELGSANYDPAADQLAVDVVTTRRDGTEGQTCTQALVGISYEAAFSFEGEIPSGVSVSHDGRGVMGAGYGSESASAPEDT